MGSKGSASASPALTTVAPAAVQSPLQGALNNQAQGRIDASNPALLSPWTSSQIAGASLQAPQTATPVYGSGQPGSTAQMTQQLGNNAPQQWWQPQNAGATLPPQAAGGYSAGGQQAMQQNISSSLATLPQLLGQKMGGQGQQPPPSAPQQQQSAPAASSGYPPSPQGSTGGSSGK